MKRVVHVRNQARRELYASVDYIAGDNVGAAMRMFEAARRAFEELAESPGLGRPYPCDVPKLNGLRKWSSKELHHYLVFYLVFDDHIDIVRFLHGARDIPGELESTEQE